MIYSDQHQFIGMGRTHHPVNQDRNMLWEAHNVRLTTRDEDTYLSIVNEKSTKEVMTFGTGETYLGHGVVGKWLVVFTHIDDDTDTIYRINLDILDTLVQKQILYQGDLDFDLEHPIQTISNYQTELLQKIYWTDGKNQPRVINVATPELDTEKVTSEIASSMNYTDIFNDAPFDFIPTLELKENVQIERQMASGGKFQPGVIQYSLTYFNKYGQESNIFYTSPLLYTSFWDRGGAPDEFVNNIFKITIGGLQKTFDYIRIYAVLRTSLDATPQVRIVQDYDIRNLEDDEVTVYDDGTQGETCDASRLLFLGGEPVTAQCMESKDYTLFLGNIEHQRQSANELISSSDIRRTVTSSTRTVELQTNSEYQGSKAYKHICQLQQNTSCLKNHETYRLGLQFQDKHGVWSEPVYIGDYTVSQYPNYRIGTEHDFLYLPTLRMIWENDEWIETMQDAGYIKVRPVIVIPDYQHKNVLTQGMVCPTVFQAGARLKNAPYSYASWFLRPFTPEPTMKYIPENRASKTSLVGSTAEYRHLRSVVAGISRAMEIQNLDYQRRYTKSDPHVSLSVITNPVDPGASNNTDYNNTWYDAYKRHVSARDYYNAWFIDQTVLTLHSGDIEQNPSVQNALDSEDLDIYLVGVIPFISNVSDTDIYLDSTVIDPGSSGVLEYTDARHQDGRYSLISELLYHDSIVDDNDGNSQTRTGLWFYPLKSKLAASKGEDNPSAYWLVSPWMRTGSINNDCARQDDEGQQSSVLKKHRISNLKFSQNIMWMDQISETYANDGFQLWADEIQMYNSDEPTILKFHDDKNLNGDIIYQGNVDVLNPSYMHFNIVMQTDDVTSRYLALDTTQITITSEQVTNTDEDTFSGEFTNGDLVISLIDAERYFFQSGTSTEESDDGTYSDESTRSADLTDNSSTYKGLIFEKIVYGIVTSETVYSLNSNNEGISTGPLKGASVTIYITKEEEYLIKIYALNGQVVELYGSNLGIETTTTDTSDVARLHMFNFRNNDDWPDGDQTWGNTGNEIGDHTRALREWKEGVRIKYKQTPHAVFTTKFSYDDTEYGYRLSMPILLRNSATADASEGEVSLAVEYDDVTEEDLYWYPKLQLDDDGNPTDDYKHNTGSDSYDDFALMQPIMIVRSGYAVPDAYLWLAEVRQNISDDIRFGGTSEYALQSNLWLPAAEATRLDELDETKGLEWWWADTWYQRYDCLKTYPYTSDDINQVIEIGSFMAETYTNLDGRYDKNRGLVSNLNMTPRVFNLINTVYSQKNNFFSYRIQNPDYYKITHFSNEFFWSNAQSPSGVIDEWTNVHLATVYDLNGIGGELTALKTWKDQIFAFQDHALSQIVFNPRVQVEGSDGIPIEIANQAGVQDTQEISTVVGCQDKFSIVDSPLALYFVDNNTYSIYQLSDKGLVDLSGTLGTLYWTRENHTDNTWLPTCDERNGIRAAYDPKYADVYFIPGQTSDESEWENPLRRAICFNESMQTFTSLFDYNGGVMFSYKGKVYSFAENPSGITTLWQNFPSGENVGYCKLYGKNVPYSVTFIANGNEGQDAANAGLNRVFDNIEILADLYKIDDETGTETLEDDLLTHVNQYGKPFKNIRVVNEYQDTGEQELDDKTLRKKFRVWRALVPRSTGNGRERIRNPWARITLSMPALDDDAEYSFKTIIHNISVKYTL